MRRRILGVLALIGCGGDAVPGHDAADGAVEAELALDWSPVVRAGGSFYALTRDPDPGALRAEIEGVRISDGPRFASEGSYVAVYTLPEDLAAGPTEVTLTDPTGGAQRLPVEVVIPTFVDVAAQTGLDPVHDVSGWPSACAQSLTGIGFADVDLDGDLDAVFGNIGADSLFFRNDGDRDGDGLPDFVDDTAGIGLLGHDRVANVSFVDYDNDGDPDLFLGRRGENRLLRNRVIPDGRVGFDDVTASSGLAGLEQRTMGSGWGDYDGDGDLDLYVVNHAWCFPNNDPEVDHRGADHLYRNDAGVFVDVSELLPDDFGEVTRRFGFTAIWVDYDRDTDLDLFVFNDHVAGGGSGVLFRNDPGMGERRFTNVAPATSFSRGPDALGKGINAMGGAVGDVNHDGLPDVAFSNIGPNFLLLSAKVDGAFVFREASEQAGVQRTFLPWEDRSVTWATHLFDGDNDGDLDVLYVGGVLKGLEPQPHAFFENKGDNTFVDRTWAVGLESPRHGKGSALVDLDEDGFLDLVIANWSDRLEVYHNAARARGNANHWLAFELVGDGERVSRDAFGSILEVTTPDGVVHTCFRNPMPSLSGTGDPACRVGLGEFTRVDTVRVFWPDGSTQDVAVDAVDRRIVVTLGAEPPSE